MAALERLQGTRDDWNRSDRIREGCPRGWNWVNAASPTRSRKVSVTLRLDRDRTTWVWRQGEGTQARMNAVLRASVQAKAEKMARGAWDRRSLGLFQTVRPASGD